MRQQGHTRMAMAGVAALMLAGGWCGAAPDTGVNQALRALDARGLLLDTQRLSQAAVDGVLRAVDPEVQRVPRGEPFQGEEGPLLVQLELYTNEILYVSLGSQASTGELARAEIIRVAVTTNTAGVVLDLRGAGGHDLDTLDDLGGLFFEDGVELYQLRDGSSNVVARHRARAPGPVPHLPPVMLLVDNQTHGTCEALAALLQHRPNVMLLGTPTRGSAAWRERVPLSETEDVLITTAWLAPITGAVYHGCGVLPDVLVTATTNTPPVDVHPPDARTDTQTVVMASTPAADTDTPISRDSLLRRATDILLGLQALRQP